MIFEKFIRMFNYFLAGRSFTSFFFLITLYGCQSTLPITTGKPENTGQLFSGMLIQEEGGWKFRHCSGGPLISMFDNALLQEALRKIEIPLHKHIYGLFEGGYYANTMLRVKRFMVVGGAPNECESLLQGSEWQFSGDAKLWGGEVVEGKINFFHHGFLRQIRYSTLQRQPDVDNDMIHFLVKGMDGKQVGEIRLDMQPCQASLQQLWSHVVTLSLGTESYHGCARQANWLARLLEGRFNSTKGEAVIELTEQKFSLIRAGQEPIIGSWYPSERGLYFLRGEARAGNLSQKVLLERQSTDLISCRRDCDFVGEGLWHKQTSLPEPQ